VFKSYVLYFFSSYEGSIIYSLSGDSLGRLTTCLYQSFYHHPDWENVEGRIVDIETGKVVLECKAPIVAQVNDDYFQLAHNF
jgi:hypothetical protein